MATTASRLGKKIGDGNQKANNALDRWDQQVDENIGVQPSRSLAKTITFSLVATSAAGFAWLALATTDEVVAAKGKLQPIDDVKVVQMPLGGVLKQMLVKDGEILLRLDNEATLERAKSAREEIRAVEAQLKLKQIELERYLSLNDARMRVLNRKLDLHNVILARLKGLTKVG
ncbi:MAG: hemolysin D, partial [Prochlorococcus sp.]